MTVLWRQRWTVTLAGAATMAMLAACGNDTTSTVSNPETGEKAEVTRSADGETTNITVKDASGNTTAMVQAGEGAALPDGMPAWAPAYPGAEVTAVMSGQASEGGSGAMVTLATGDSVDTVAKYYEGRMKQVGVAPGTTVASGQSRMFGIEGKDGGPGGMITIAAEGDRTTIAIVYGRE